MRDAKEIGKVIPRTEDGISSPIRMTVWDSLMGTLMDNFPQPL